MSLILQKQLATIGKSQGRQREAASSALRTRNLCFPFHIHIVDDKNLEDVLINFNLVSTFKFTPFIFLIYPFRIFIDINTKVITLLK